MPASLDFQQSLDSESWREQPMHTPQLPAMPGQDSCWIEGGGKEGRLSSIHVQSSRFDAQSRILGRNGRHASFSSGRGHERPPMTTHTAEQSIGDRATQDEVIAAIDMKNNGALGCAVYDMSDNSLAILEDISSADIELIESLMIHIQPSTILLQNRTPELITDYLERHANVAVDGRPRCKPSDAGAD